MHSAENFGANLFVTTAFLKQNIENLVGLCRFGSAVRTGSAVRVGWAVRSLSGFRVDSHRGRGSFHADAPRGSHQHGDIPIGASV